MFKIDVADFEWQVVANPNALGKRSLEHWPSISGIMSSKGIRHVLHRAESTGKGIEIARKLCAEGHRHLMVLGGDGTINEVVNGICESGVPLNAVYLAVMPVGRGNDWARSHNYSTKVDGNMEIFFHGRFIQHDIGMVRTIYDDVEKAHRYFINIAGFGFDAEVIYDVTHNKPRFLGISVYILSLLRTVFSFRSQPIVVQAPDLQFDGKSFLMVAGICQYNGGGMRQVPMAVPDDGLLDVVVVPDVSLWTVFKHFKKIFAGNHIHAIEGIKTCRVSHLEVSSEKLLRGEVEGELLPTGNYIIEVVPQKLNVLTNL